MGEKSENVLVCGLGQSARRNRVWFVKPGTDELVLRDGTFRAVRGRRWEGMRVFERAGSR